MRQGETIEVDLPRNLTCANCDGGGCDLCNRAGATSLRGRKDPPESVEITLPTRSDLSDGMSVVLRIPERGGLSSDPTIEARGLLLLRVEITAEAGDGVRLTRPTRMSLVELAVSNRTPPVLRLGLLLVGALLLWLLTTLLLRLLG